MTVSPDGGRSASDMMVIADDGGRLLVFEPDLSTSSGAKSRQKRRPDWDIRMDMKLPTELTGLRVLDTKIVTVSDGDSGLNTKGTELRFVGMERFWACLDWLVW